MRLRRGLLRLPQYGEVAWQGSPTLEHRQAVLAAAEKVAGAALLQVGLCDAEAVIRAAERLRRRWRVSGFLLSETSTHQAFALPRPDAPTQLVQLCKAEALGVFNDHERGVGHVDTHLDDGGGDEDVRLLLRRSEAMTASFSAPFILPWSEGHAQIREHAVLQRLAPTASAALSVSPPSPPSSSTAGQTM